MTTACGWTLADLEPSIARACDAIAPTWPLDRFIAVNPLWGCIDRPLPEVAARLGALSGTRLLMPRAWYRERWQAGDFGPEHLRQAIERTGSTRSPAELLTRLESEAPPMLRRPLVVDVLDTQRDLEREMGWREFVVHSVSRLCATYFGDLEGDAEPLYAMWLRYARVDWGPELAMGLDCRAAIGRLPLDPRTTIATALQELGIDAMHFDDYLSALLLDVQGWAAWCAYLRWTASQAGRSDDRIVDLLAIRIGWELLLHRSGGSGLAARWRLAVAQWPAFDRAAEAGLADDWVFQVAIEIAYQDEVGARLPAGLGDDPRPDPAPAVQAVFCIDVRSEVIRRGLEAQSPAVQTLGFAGFFGLPIEYRPLGSTTWRPQLPGLLAPQLRARDAAESDALARARTRRLGFQAAWSEFQRNPISGFSFVESMGLLYAGKLLAHGFGLARPTASPERAGLSRAQFDARKPRWVEDDVATRCNVAARILGAMSLTSGFARVVALIGHGSSTTNNPHAAGLDCGACCGQTGEVNARAVAALLNEPQVRAGLVERGIEIPATTHFVPGLHDTTTDEVELFDLDEVPPSHAVDIATLQGWFRGAGERARAERALGFGSAGSDPQQTQRTARRRAMDWSEVRPEWGLADNAAFIVAPRQHTRHCDFGGRTFLHDYRWRDDVDFAVLELIMTAPMLVTHWINFQYYASTVDNLRYGSGNKVLHNVVGEHIGVFEGNGGDLRIGLPMQSLHDGRRWVHTPLRLGVYIEAPRFAIDDVLGKHDTVRRLIDGGWLWLFQLDDEERAVYAYRDRAWARVHGPRR